VATRWIRTNLRSAFGAAAIGVVSGIVLGLLFLIPNMGGQTQSMDVVYRDFPHDRPPITHWLSWMGSVPEFVSNSLPFIAISLLAVVGLLNALVLRPASREAAVAVGLISGLSIALLTFVISSGWAPVKDTSVMAGENDIRLMASAMWSDSNSDRDLAQRQ
jgi:ABC-type amino acid transport system permease subunit